MKQYVLPLIFVIITLLFTTTQLSAEDKPYEYDIPGGMVETFFDIDINDSGGVSCEIKARPTNRDKKWTPGILLTISGADDPFSTQVIFSPSDDFHYFDIRMLDTPNSYEYVSNFLKIRRSEDPVTASISWSKNGIIHYKGEDSQGQESSGYITNKNQKFKKIRVTLSGVKGSILCYMDQME